MMYPILSFKFLFVFKYIDDYIKRSADQINLRTVHVREIVIVTF